MSNLFRTDLALELEKGEILEKNGDINISVVKLDSEKAKKYNKAEGKYTSIESMAISNGEYNLYDRLGESVSKVLRSYFKSKTGQTILVVGLGNADMTADALGPLTVSHLRIGDKIKAILPSVMGKTGIESFEIIKGVCDVIKPDLVIAIDSLSAGNVDRVCNVVQFSNSGITPGSGVANHRMTISKDTLGVEVISIGVPLVVYASVIASNAGGSGGSAYLNSLVVTPKDIDLLVRDCSMIIASGINSAYS